MRTLLLSLVAVLLAADGYVHGLWTGRWKTSHDLDDAKVLLPTVPMELGEWKAKEKKLPPRHVEVAGFAAYFLRSYEKPGGGAVNVLLACGPPGPLAVHTPEVCYVGNGFVPVEGPIREVLPLKGRENGAEFWKATYEKRQGLGVTSLRVYWSWCADGSWQAPTNPRWSFAGLPVLHKMYVTCAFRGSSAPADAACAEFLKGFLPELDRKLFAAAPPHEHD